MNDSSTPQLTTKIEHYDVDDDDGDADGDAESDGVDAEASGDDGPAAPIKTLARRTIYVKSSYSDVTLDVIAIEVPPRIRDCRGGTLDLLQHVSVSG